MQRSRVLASLAGSLVLSGLAVGLADDTKITKPGSAVVTPKKVIEPTPVPFAQQEIAAWTLVREQLPELAQVLDPLKTTKVAEYRKAITEIATEAKKLESLHSKNPARAALALDAWKSRTRVELFAAQLAGSPTSERTAQLRSAIESRVEVDIRRHRFEVDQAETVLSKAREALAEAETNRNRTRDALSRLESNRDARIEARFRALLPKKGTPTVTKPGLQSPPNGGPAPAPMPITSLQIVPLSSSEFSVQGILR